MKLLALIIGGTPVQLPNQIGAINTQAGTFGVHIIQLTIGLLILAAMLLMFIFIFYGGFKWLTSQGDKKNIEEARSTIIFALVGFVVVALAYLGINILGHFLNLPNILTLSQ